MEQVLVLLVASLVMGFVVALAAWLAKSELKEDGDGDSLDKSIVHEAEKQVQQVKHEQTTWAEVRSRYSVHDRELASKIKQQSDNDPAGSVIVPDFITNQVLVSSILASQSGNEYSGSGVQFTTDEQYVEHVEPSRLESREPTHVHEHRHDVHHHSPASFHHDTGASHTDHSSSCHTTDHSSSFDSGSGFSSSDY